MNPTLREEITRRLVEQYHAKVGNTYLSKIECPSCGKREAFTDAVSPWVIKCGRDNKCGELHHVKDLFPELFQTWTERYAPKTLEEQNQNPTAVADGYLRDGRGFDLLKIRGWYTQETYFDHTLNQGTTTVRFALPHGHWERLLDKPQRFGKQKARIVGTYKGEVWIPPALTLEQIAASDEVWIAEGIFDAIALLHAGKVAVSNLSSANYPDQFLAALKQAAHARQLKTPLIIWAQDSDNAGRKATLKHRDKSEAAGFTCAAAQIPFKGRRRRDWNDLLQLHLLSDKDFENYRYHGDLLLAKSPVAKALLIYNQREQREFWFDFGGKLWWWKLDMESYDRELRSREEYDIDSLSPEERATVLKNAGMLSCICSAVPTPLYFQANKVTDESWYYFRIELPDGSTHKHAFTPKQLTGANEFKNRLLAIKNAWWTGSGKQLDRLMQDQMAGLQTVDTVTFIGYSPEHEAYIFSDKAVKNGKEITMNDEDFFEFGKLSIKSLSSSPVLNINSEQNDYNANWSRYLYRAYGHAGVVVTAFWLGSLFAEQIRARQKSYPFLELVGEAGSGKSTLLEFLWKTCGRTDYEGFDPSKSSNAARARSFSQVSNLPVVLIEADREQQDKTKARQFDWDELKTAFNGRSIRSLGVKNNGNDTYEPPFRGSIVISQNAQVEASEAILSRIVHITMNRDHHSDASREAAKWLESVPIESVSGFILQATKAEKKLLALIDELVLHYETELLALGEIRMVRIAKCHSQLMALVACLGPKGLGLFPEQIIEQSLQFVRDMAVQRQLSLNADHPLVAEFWEAFDYIEATGSNDQGNPHPKLNHLGADARQIAVNLKEFESWCGEFKLHAPDARTLKKLLRSSKTRKFIEANKSIASRIKRKTVKCWLFEAAN